jgi:hypothetical protein
VDPVPDPLLLRKYGSAGIELLLYLEKLALTSPTSEGRSVGMVRLPTKATEFVFFSQ